MSFLEKQRSTERERSQRKEPKSSETGALAAIREERVAPLSHQLTLSASRIVLAHKLLEIEFLETGKWSGAGAMLTQEAELHLHVTHMLGHMLGDKLYWGLVGGLVQKSMVRELFHSQLEEDGVALNRYLELVALVQDIEHGPPRSDRL